MVNLLKFIDQFDVLGSKFLVRGAQSLYLFPVFLGSQLLSRLLFHDDFHCILLVFRLEIMVGCKRGEVPNPFSIHDPRNDSEYEEQGNGGQD